MEELIAQIDLDLKEYSNIMKIFEEQKDAAILMAELKDSPKEAAPVQTQGKKDDWSTFKPNNSLKPTFMEKESTALEVKNFCQLFDSCILDRFPGKPRKEAIHLLLSRCSTRPCGLSWYKKESRMTKPWKKLQQ